MRRSRGQMRGIPIDPEHHSNRKRVYPLGRELSTEDVVLDEFPEDSPEEVVLRLIHERGTATKMTEFGSSDLTGHFTNRLTVIYAVGIVTSTRGPDAMAGVMLRLRDPDLTWRQIGEKIGRPYVTTWRDWRAFWSAIFDSTLQRGGR